MVEAFICILYLVKWNFDFCSQVKLWCLSNLSMAPLMYVQGISLLEMGSGLVPENGRSFVVGDYNVLLLYGMPLYKEKMEERMENGWDLFQKESTHCFAIYCFQFYQVQRPGARNGNPFPALGHNRTQTWLPRHPIATRWATAHPLFLLTQTKSPKKPGFPLDGLSNGKKATADWALQW